MSKIKLSISILVSRNYEGVKRCLDSLQPILNQVSSELILTDTGCGEEVRGLIEQYTDNIIDFEWIKDFSAARNVGLKAAKGEWFMYMDDDEWFEDVTEIVDFFNSRECDRYNIATYVIRNYLDMNGDKYGEQNADRIIKITPELHFEHRIHEAYTGVGVGNKKKLNTYAHHYGYVYKDEEEKISKIKRNRELLIMECRDFPDDMRMRYHLVKDYCRSNEYDEAIKTALQGIKKKSDSEYWDALHTEILSCCQYKKDWDSLIKYGEDFLKDNLFPTEEFGVKQYLICAYWSKKKYWEVCGIASKTISTYIDYKKKPAKYDPNQLMIDEFWQEENICKMFLFIIDSAIATKDGEIIEKLLNHNIREELVKIANNETYRTWAIQMMSATCQDEEQLELWKKIPISNDIDLDIMTDVPEIEFERLQFEPEFFEPETREGFYIEPLIKNAWAAQLQTLSMFDKICEENDLTYSVDWGTLLGAIRHKGFIPWDDDLDVCMPREDLMRFYKIIPYYPELECLNPYNTPDLGIHASRLMLSRDFTVDRDRLKDLHGFPFPVGIDIFNVDYVPRDKVKEEEQIELMEKVNYAANLTILIDEHDEKEEEYKKAYKRIVREIKELTDIEFTNEEPDLYELTVLYDEIQSTYNEEDADYISELPNIMIGREYYLPKDTYDNLIRVSFENLMVPVPKNYDEVLKIKYGDDYMKPEYVGGGHGYPFYDEQIEDVMNSMGSNSFDETKAHIEKLSSEYYRNFLNRTLDSTGHFEDDILDRNDNRIRAALLEVLDEIDRLCRNHNIEYFFVNETKDEIEDIKALNSDSLDIHIAMNRIDYMNFQQILQEELGVWFDYRSIYSNADHTDMRTYIITDAYETNEGEYEKRFFGCNDIVGIDIASIDYVNDDNAVEELKKNVIEQLLTISASMPTNPPYDESIIAVVKEWEDLLHVGINIEGNLANEFVKVADSVAMSDANSSYNRVRVSADIGDDNYKIFEKSEFDL